MGESGDLLMDWVPRSWRDATGVPGVWGWINSAGVSWDGRSGKGNMKSLRCVSCVCEDQARRQPLPGTWPEKPWAGEVALEKIEPWAHSQDQKEEPGMNPREESASKWREKLGMLRPPRR